MALLSERIELAIAHWEKKHGKKSKDAVMARGIGVERATIGDWRHGRTKDPEGKNVRKAARYLGVDEEWLAEGKGEMIPETTIVTHPARSKFTTSPAEIEGITPTRRREDKMPPRTQANFRGAEDDGYTRG